MQEYLCSDVAFPSLRGTDYVNALLSETQYILRPTKVYVGRIDDDNPLTIQIYVTEYGETVTYKQVRIFLYSVDKLPSAGVTVDSDLKETDESGLVSFTFAKTGSIPYPRQYSQLPETCSAEVEEKICDPDTKICVLPIEGQVYQFNYCVQLGDESCSNNENMLFWPIVVLGFSDFETPSIPTWSEHIGPIFSIQTPYNEHRSGPWKL